MDLLYPPPHPPLDYCTEGDECLTTDYYVRAWDSDREDDGHSTSGIPSTDIETLTNYLHDIPCLPNFPDLSGMPHTAADADENKPFLDPSNMFEQIVFAHRVHEAVMAAASSQPPHTTVAGNESNHDELTASADFVAATLTQDRYAIVTSGDNIDEQSSAPEVDDLVVVLGDLSVELSPANCASLPSRAESQHDLNPQKKSDPPVTESMAPVVDESAGFSLQGSRGGSKASKESCPVALAKEISHCKPVSPSSVEEPGFYSADPQDLARGAQNRTSEYMDMPSSFPMENIGSSPITHHSIYSDAPSPLTPPMPLLESFHNIPVFHPTWVSTPVFTIPYAVHRPLIYDEPPLPLVMNGHHIHTPHIMEHSPTTPVRETTDTALGAPTALSPMSEEAKRTPDTESQTSLDPNQSKVGFQTVARNSASVSAEDPHEGLLSSTPLTSQPDPVSPFEPSHLECPVCSTSIEDSFTPGEDAAPFPDAISSTASFQSFCGPLIFSFHGLCSCKGHLGQSGGTANSQDSPGERCPRSWSFSEEC